MKILTQTTTAGNTYRGSQGNIGRLFNRAAQRGEIFQRCLQTLLGRFFFTHHFAPIRAYSTKGGARPIWRDRQSHE